MCVYEREPMRCLCFFFSLCFCVIISALYSVGSKLCVCASGKWHVSESMRCACIVCSLYVYASMWVLFRYTLDCESCSSKSGLIETYRTFSSYKYGEYSQIKYVQAMMALDNFISVSLRWVSMLSEYILLLKIFFCSNTNSNELNVDNIYGQHNDSEYKLPSDSPNIHRPMDGDVFFLWITEIELRFVFIRSSIKPL